MIQNNAAVASQTTTNAVAIRDGQPAPQQTVGSLEQTFAGMVETRNKTSQGFRLPTKKEFKDRPENKGKTGKEITKAYNALIRTKGQQASNFVGAFIAERQLLFKGVRETKNGAQLSFVKKAAVRDPKADKVEVRKPTTQELQDALKTLSAEQISALLASAK